MLSKNFFRSLFAICLSCLLLLNSSISPAFADNESSIGEFGRSFENGFGHKLGEDTETITVGLTFLAVCYAVDAKIAPSVPLVAAVLAPVCLVGDKLERVFAH
jgi:hypothetical protein